MNTANFNARLIELPPEKLGLIAIRAALRAFPLSCTDEPFYPFGSLIIPNARLITTTFINLKRPNEKNKAALKDAIEWIDKKANPKGSFSFGVPAVGSAAATVRAANVLINDHPSSQAGTAVYRSNNELGNLYGREIREASEKAAFFDLEKEYQDLLGAPIWEKLTSEQSIIHNTEVIQKLDEPEMTFWKHWYEGFLNGQPPDWRLQEKIALIDNDVWDEGAQAVAAEIERIQAEHGAEWLAHETRFPEYEPQTVSHIWENQHLFAMSSGGVSAAITRDIDALQAEGINQFPEHFEPLRGVSVSSFRISGILSAANHNDESDQVLKEEIGRLTALVVKQTEEIGRLKTELEAARAKSEEDQIGPQIKTAVKSFLWKGAGIGAALSVIWGLSGSDVRLEERVRNLKSDRDYLLKFFDFPEEELEVIIAPTVEV